MQAIWSQHPADTADPPPPYSTSQPHPPSWDFKRNRVQVDVGCTGNLQAAHRSREGKYLFLSWDITHIVVQSKVSLDNPEARLTKALAQGLGKIACTSQNYEIAGVCWSGDLKGQAYSGETHGNDPPPPGIFVKNTAKSPSNLQVPQLLLT